MTTKNPTINHHPNQQSPTTTVMIDDYISNPVLEAQDLKLWFPVQAGLLRKTVGHIQAVNKVSFKLASGKTLGIVGESGCGKTTLGKLLIRLYKPDSGTLKLLGEDITHLSNLDMRPKRKNIQMIFQDPIDSLNQRITIEDNLKEPFYIQNSALTEQQITKKIKEFLTRVGVDTSTMNRYPHEFSGGQCQRIVIARALILNPKVIICDEPVSALDVSVQSQVINIILELQQSLGVSFVFIAHDLTVVRHISDQVMVMYLGEVMEYAPSIAMYQNPLHPYTKALLDAQPKVITTDTQHLATGSQTKTLKGELPSPINPPPGCKFHTRCPYVVERCKTEVPKLRLIKNPKSNDTSGLQNHYVSCHLIETTETKLE